MFYPIALYIGLRYTRAKRRNHFISFISLTSMIGIALGVAVLITVLSVMNGFDQEIRSRIFGMANHITISTLNGRLRHWQTVADQVNYPGVVASAPFVSGQGLLLNRGLNHPSMITGIDPAQEPKVSVIAQKMIAGHFNDLQPGRFGILIGEQLAQSLGLDVGDKVTLLIPSATVTPLGVMPRYKPFTVVGIFKVGNGFGFDSDFGYINIKDAQILFQLGNAVSGLRLKLTDLYLAPKLTQTIAQKLPSDYVVSNWTYDFGSLFHAVQLEKTMMFLILLLLIAVAAFNLVSTLVMVVTDKQADIAILRTLGATPRTILAIFMVQGSVVGFVGTFLGLMGGITLALNVTQLVNWIQKVFHVQLLSSNVYYVNFLPSQLLWSDVWHICVAALLMSLVATLYPAWRAARTQPAEALRYE